MRPLLHFSIVFPLPLGLQHLPLLVNPTVPSPPWDPFSPYFDFGNLTLRCSLSTEVSGFFFCIAACGPQSIFPFKIPPLYPVCISLLVLTAIIRLGQPDFLVIMRKTYVSPQLQCLLRSGLSEPLSVLKQRCFLSPFQRRSIVLPFLFSPSSRAFPDFFLLGHETTPVSVYNTCRSVCSSSLFPCHLPAFFPFLFSAPSTSISQNSSAGRC